MSNEYAVGQVWTWPIPEGFEDSRIIIGAVETLEDGEEVICIAATAVSVASRCLSSNARALSAYPEAIKTAVRPRSFCNSCSTASDRSAIIATGRISDARRFSTIASLRDNPLATTNASNGTIASNAI